MNKLPLGIQEVADIQRGDYYCADKTPLISRVLPTGRPCIAHRPSLDIIDIRTWHPPTTNQETTA